MKKIKKKVKIIVCLSTFLIVLSLCSLVFEGIVNRNGINRFRDDVEILDYPNDIHRLKLS